MHVTAHLDVDLVAVEQEDHVTLMLELTAPPEPGGRERATGTVEVVLDRSGSMSGDRLDAALGALDQLVARLDERDRFGLVAFDDELEVVVPAGPLHDKHSARQAIAALPPGGSTNLSGGYLRGIQEARRVADAGGATLLLLSDGLANVGVKDPARLEQVAAGAQRAGVTTSTLGLGLGYDETIMSAIARGGAGAAHFAEEADTAAALIAGEVNGLLSQAAQAASLIIHPTGSVEGLTVWHDLTSTAIEDGVMVELGTLHHEEKRKLVIGLNVPAMPGLGLAKVADLELRYVELPSLTIHTVEVPVHVNVVPGDQAAGRMSDAHVTSELAFQQAQIAKRRAGEALRGGDHAGACELYFEAGATLAAASASAPAEMRAELVGEAELLHQMAGRVEWDDPSRLSKFGEADRAAKGRQRGRPRGR